MLNARTAALNRGRNGPVQLYSGVRAPSADADQLTWALCQPGMGRDMRLHSLTNSDRVSQFAVLWDDSVGILTKPTLVTLEDGQEVVHGSYSDVIGQATPVEIPLDALMDRPSCSQQATSKPTCDRWRARPTTSTLARTRTT